MKNLVGRFMRYVTFDTQSKPKNHHCPSSTGQKVFAQALYEELLELGLSDVSLDDHGYVMAKLPSNVNYPVPAIGFIATWTPLQMLAVSMLNRKSLKIIKVVILPLVKGTKCCRPFNTLTCICCMAITSSRPMAQPYWVQITKRGLQKLSPRWKSCLLILRFLMAISRLHSRQMKRLAAVPIILMWRNLRRSGIYHRWRPDWRAGV